MSETIVFNQHQKLLSPLELVWLLGPERGKRFLLLGGRQTFGRSKDNEIILPDETISTHHGVLVYAAEGEVLFYDTASRNGISRDGKRAPILTLKFGQQIQIGSVYLKLVKAGQVIDEMVPEKKRIRGLRSLIGLAIVVFFFGGVSLLKQERHAIPVVSAPAAAVANLSIPKGRKSGGLSQRRMDRTKVKGLLRATQLGEQAEGAFEQGNFIEAYSLWKQVLGLDPMNQPAQEGLQKLEKVAGKLYEEALMMKTSAPDQFKEKIQIALAISEPASEIHARVERLAGGVRSGGSL